MSVPGTHAVICENFAATAGRFRFRPKIELDRFPSVAALRLQTQSCSWLITAMHHAVFTTTVARHAIDDAVSVPLCLFEQFRVSRIVRVGHEIAGTFPATNVSGGNSPG